MRRNILAVSAILAAASLFFIAWAALDISIHLGTIANAYAG